MTRNGKIARLPHPVREQVNRRLQNGDEGKHIVAWLNGLPEARAKMGNEIDGRIFNETNVSNWKTGGYRDWEAQQEALEAVRRFRANAANLNQAAGGDLADQLAVCLTARIAVALQQSDSEDDPVAQLQRLRLLCSDLVALRKGDHNAQRLRLEREKLDLNLKEYKDEVAARRREKEGSFKRRKKGGLSKKALKLIERELKLL